MLDVDVKAPPFDQLKGLHRLATERSGHKSVEHVRHHLFVGRDKSTAANMLVKLTSKPGLVYQQNLSNEIATLTTINRELPDSRAFPIVVNHGRLPDGRTYLTTYLFDELPLATTIGTEPNPSRLVANLRTTIAVARALEDLHRLSIFHVDLNPMNILYRSERSAPVVRIIDFESSYETARHARGEFYNPPTTTGYCAPEIPDRPPDARADVFSLGAVLYTLLAGYQWTWKGDVGPMVNDDPSLDGDLRTILKTAVHSDADARYPTMAALDDAVSGYLESIWPGRAI